MHMQSVENTFLTQNKNTLTLTDNDMQKEFTYLSASASLNVLSTLVIDHHLLVCSFIKVFPLKMWAGFVLSN